MPHVPAGGAAPVDTGKQLNISIDQGSDGWCPAVFLLCGLFLRIVLFFDPSHRVWNDVKGALSEQGLWDIILLFGVVHNVSDGPYEGAAWWRETQEAAESYSSENRATCPLLLHLLPRIAAERNEQHRLLDPAYPAEVSSTVMETMASLVKQGAEHADDTVVLVSC